VTPCPDAPDADIEPRPTRSNREKRDPILACVPVVDE
jgi:hypothetical protein